jgi:hypothetical protein
VAVGSAGGVEPSDAGVPVPDDVADAVLPDVPPAACWPDAEVWTVMSSTLAGTFERSKKTTSSKAGGRFPGHTFSSGVVATVEPVGVIAGLSDLLRLTRVTPSMLRRRDSSVATVFCVGVQPVSSTAGAAMAVRTVEPLPPAPPEIVPLSEVSVTSDGTTREMSRSACSQSKREDARSLMVWIRVSAICWKSAYGLSWLTRWVVVAASAVTASSCA